MEGVLGAQRKKPLTCLDRILGGRDIIPLGQAGGNLEGVGDTEQLRMGLNNVHTCACV